ncbi:hypothetical protein [Streptomyces sp. SLBN-31]|uniref:hypothetical protein n=1 Tax=Streptomyces sp. SLBN-31 TaxID=2768444 RepID=UPI00117017AE|nr:hypothetical protein [Streptomyces sp. SLBN-31]TQJ75187.1 hypothetical protein FBY22_8224 [Streptomyces sp. SLBN-31]
MQLPEDQMRAGHIPADIYRHIPHGTDLHKVVIVQEAPRSYKGPIVLALVITAGSIAVLLVVAFVVQVIAAAAVAVLSASGGISYTLHHGKHKELSRAGAPRRSRAPRKTRPRPVRSARRYRK